MMITLASASRDMVYRIGIVYLLAATLVPIVASAQTTTTKEAPAWMPTKVNSGDTLTFANFAATRWRALRCGVRCVCRDSSN